MSAQVTITQLPVAGAITGTEAVPVVQNGVTKQTTAAALAGSPVQTQTFITVNQEPTLANSRYLGATNGLTLSASSPQGVLNITTTGVLSTLGSGGVLTVPNGGTGASSLTGILKGTGATPVTIATAGTDYQAPITLTTTGTSGVATFAGNTLNIPNYAAGMTSGTVTQVSVVSANGLAGTVATDTTTPAITLSTSVTGVLKGNGTAISAAAAGTDYQAPITLTTIGTSGAATLISNTLNIPQYSGGGGGVTTITFGSTGLTPSTATSGAVTVAGTLAVANGGTGVTTSSGANSVVLRDANNNITANAFFNSFNSITASGTTVTLTVASAPVQYVSGSGGQTIKLPDATTLANGTIFSFNNNQSSGAITVNNNSNTLVVSVPSGAYVTVVLLSNATAAGSWDRHDQTPSNTSWSTNTLDYPGSITSATWNGTAVAVNRGGTGATTLTGILKGNGTSAFTAATAGTDYQAPITLTTTGTSGAATLISNTLNIPQYTGGGGSSTITISNKTANYTVVSGDLGYVINCTANSFTVSLTAAATLGAGFNVTIWNTSATSADVITITPNGAETIDGKASITLQRGGGVNIVCDGTNWQVNTQRYLKAFASNPAPANNYPIATGTNSLAFGMGTTSSGDTSIAIGGAAVSSGTLSFATQGSTASATRSTAIGQNSSSGGSQAVTGTGAMALGGSYASGVDSFAAAIGNNTSSYGATGANCVAIGYLAKATASGGLALGSQATSTNSSIAISVNGLRSVGATASSNGGCIAIGGNVNASEFSAIALGQDAVAAGAGKLVFSPVRLSANGDAQTGTTVLSASTTNATAKALTTGDFGTGTASYQLILQNNSAFSFTGTVIARQSAAGGTASAAWKVEGLIRREANAGTTTLVTSTVTAISNVPGWTLALSADTTNGCLAVTATGAAATNIRWVATLNTSEVTYA